ESVVAFQLRMGNLKSYRLIRAQIDGTENCCHRAAGDDALHPIVVKLFAGAHVCVWHCCRQSPAFCPHVELGAHSICRHLQSGFDTASLPRQTESVPRDVCTRNVGSFGGASALSGLVSGGHEIGRTTAIWVGAPFARPSSTSC